MKASQSCAIEGCSRPRAKREWCDMHYQRWKNTGNPYVGRELPISRFFAKVSFENPPCWEWQGTMSPKGYGVFSVGGEQRRAHVWIYEYFYGAVPEGLVLDHFYCSRTSCVNPMHVRPVTIRENLLRGETHAARNAAKTECINGHPLEGDNLAWSGAPGKKSRVCRECHRTTNREAARRKAARKREEQKADALSEVLRGG